MIPARRSRSRLSLLLGAAASLAWGIVPYAPAARAQAEIVIELPGDQGPPPPGIEAQVFEIEVDRGQLERAALPPGEVPLGELSPTNPATYAAGTITIQVRSPTGFFVPYQVEARTQGPSGSGNGDFMTSDVGLGVLNVVAANPVINPRFNYDPRIAPKNVDDEPIFDGTVATLPPNPPRLWLYRTQGFWVGQWNSFVLAFAVGPQFFAPSGPESMRIQVTVRNL